MGRLADSYRYKGNNPYTNLSIDKLSTLESIKSRQGWMIAAQIATIGAISSQTSELKGAINVVDSTLREIKDNLENGLQNLEDSLLRIEVNLLENLNEIKWYLINVDQKLDQVVNLLKFSGATKSSELNKQGFVLYKTGEYDKALNQFNKSLEENPLNIDAYINLGYTYLRKDDLQNSLKSFTEASKYIDEDFSYQEEVDSDKLKNTKNFILENIASLFMMKKEYESSLKILFDLKNQLEDEDKIVVNKFNIAKAFCLNKQYQESLIELKELMHEEKYNAISIAISDPDFVKIKDELLKELQINLEQTKESLVSSISKLKIHDVFKIDNFDKKEFTIKTISQAESFLDYISDSIVLIENKFKESFLFYVDYLNLLLSLILESNSQNQEVENENSKLEKLILLNNNLLESNTKNSNNLQNLSISIFNEKLYNNIKQELINKKSSLTEIIKLSSLVNEFFFKEIRKFNFEKENDFLRVIMIEFMPLQYKLNKLRNVWKSISDKDEFDQKVKTNYQKIIDKHYDFKLPEIWKLNELMCELFDIDLNTSRELSKNPNRLREMTSELEKDKQEILLKTTEEFQNRYNEK